MPSPCAVCEMPSSGLHFGVSCCRACAAFFRRTLSLRLKYKCRFSGSCEVTQKKRYSCRHCRFEKCVRVGMRKEMVQMANVSNVPDPYDGAKPSSSNPGSNASYSSCSPPEPVYRIPAIVRNDNYQHIQNGSYVNTSSTFHFTNAQMILKAKIDVLFDMEFNLNAFPYAIPLSVCQQAMIAYANHCQHWPQCRIGKTHEADVIDIEHLLRDTYIEIEYLAEFAMSLQPFSQLPKDQKWLLFRNFWPGFFELDRCFHTCKILGYDINDERSVCLDGTIVNFKGHVARLDIVSDLNEEQIKKLMRPTHDLFRDLVTVPFKRLRPNEFELLYMVICCMWNVKHIPNVTKETINIAEQVKNRLAEDVHSYYTYELRTPNYASRLHKMSSIVSAVDKLQERRKEDSQLSRLFNIFKHDIFMSELV
ncbi:unnamed protein product [Cylicocyclus nassatus]|uniref:Uncharacterized protein n=1 Tax=Cylicocyclus nassatus TaxID=53992 RepID=A0AA36HF67_CYLNA|nr:unnamed protein product [Cylicocyclus nassatus]